MFKKSLVRDVNKKWVQEDQMTALSPKSFKTMIRKFCEVKYCKEKTLVTWLSKLSLQQ